MAFLEKNLKVILQEGIHAYLDSACGVQFWLKNKKGRRPKASPFFLPRRNSASGNESVGLMKLGVFHREPIVDFQKSARTAARKPISTLFIGVPSH
jgi:hypothetical protein